MRANLQKRACWNGFAQTNVVGKASLILHLEPEEVSKRKYNELSQFCVSLHHHICFEVVVFVRNSAEMSVMKIEIRPIKNFFKGQHVNRQKDSTARPHLQKK